MTEDVQQAPRDTLLHRLRRFLSGSLGVVLVILFVKGCLVDQYNIPSDSMEPTLTGTGRFLHDDRVLVNKWWYGPRVPFTHWRPWRWHEPERWDMVVFHTPETFQPRETMVKRVVGLPGERIFLWNGHPFVNGEAIEVPEDLQFLYYYNNADVAWEARNAKTDEQRTYWEALGDGVPMRYGMLSDEEYRIMKESEHRKLNEQELAAVHGGNLDLMGDNAFLVVPEDCYFLLGDKSHASIDSRMMGWVPRDHLLGRVIAVWWPWAHRRDFTGFTGTWWGVVFLYLLPAAFVTWEIARTLRRRKARRRA